jgi:hypothetical protein
MEHRILYLGDTALDQQAAYLAGIMSYYHCHFDYLRSDKKFSESLLERDYGLVIISDYPAANFSEKQMHAVAEKVKDGMGLLMIGGWESFTGSGGDYRNTLFAEVLPVIMQSRDDRVNFSSPCLIIKEKSHEIIDSLPFDQNVPVIGGLNAFTVKRDSTVLLSAVEYKAMRNGKTINFKESRKYPLLVVGDYCLGRTAAFASDVAPHWVGPFVDWGDERIKARADGYEAIEVGNWYAEFFINLIKWMRVKK